MRRALIILASLSVIAVVAVVLVVRSVRPPELSSFYRTPAPVTRGTPGDLLRTESVTVPGDAARVWRILYASTDLKGALVTTSGLVAAPTTPAPAGGYPLVAVAHGTVGINQRCAPSIEPFASSGELGTTYDYLVGQYVRAGYAVVMSDFAGLGAPGTNSYLVGDVEGRNVLDAIRAVNRFKAVPVRPDVLVAGQSQGGHAALFAGQLASTYAPELRIDGVVAQAPATDLEALFAGLTRSGKRGGIVSLPVMAADAYAKTYPAVKLDRVLTRRGRGALANVIEPLCLFPTILATQLARPKDLIKPGGLAVLKPYILRNVPGTRFRMPIFLAQGSRDQVVPPAINGRYAARLCAAGAALTFKTYPTAGHFDVVGASTADVLSWMAAVRRGAAPPTTCAR